MIPNLRELFLEHVGQTSDSPMLLEVTRADGVYLYGPQGKRWIDLVSGVSVSNLGHGNPKIKEAVYAQVQDYMHLMVYGEAIQSPQVRYAQRLSSLLPEELNTVYFVNSGSEAVEGALKLAKRYTGRSEMLYFRNAYHGSTHGALSVMGGEEYRNSFRPLLPDTKMLEFNDLGCIEAITTSTACVIVEPIQGEGGIIPATKEFLWALRQRCTEVGALLIFDEIPTGTGRTGKLYAFQNYDLVPDVLCTAKSFGGGMPLGAFISSNRVMSCLKTNPALGHITTFGGHPVCCAAGLAALEYLLDNNVMCEVEAKGQMYEDLLSVVPQVKEIRRAGLLMAIEFGDQELTRKIVLTAIDSGLLTEWFLFHETAMRIAPPLTITAAEIEESCRILIDVIGRVTTL